MRELTVRIRFTKHSLGNVKARDGSGRFFLPRSPRGAVTFLASWHHANMKFAAQVLGRHQDEIRKIHWDINVDGRTRRNAFYQRWYGEEGSHPRYIRHEAFFPDQIVGINCVVPSVISDDDFWRLMQLVGQYRGLSPWKPGEYGFFEVVSIRPRRGPLAVEEGAETEPAPLPTVPAPEE